VRISPEVFGSGNCYVQLYIYDSGSGQWWDGWKNASAADMWIQFGGDLLTGLNLSSISLLGIQIVSGTGATAGDIWIDEYEVIPAPNTPTPTPSGGCTVATLKSLYNFDFDLECWNQGGNPTGTTMSKDSSIYQAGGGCLRLNVPFATGADAYAEINYPSPVDILVPLMVPPGRFRSRCSLRIRVGIFHGRG
jgi:hypothetical protein